MRSLTFLAAAVLLAGCAHDDHESTPHHVKTEVKSTAKHVGRSTERTFKHIGHKMHDFFRGEETSE